MQQHEAHGSSQTEITTGSTGQLEALVGLIRSDAFAMTFQSVKQYREALINAAAAVQGEPAEQYNHKRIGWELERTAMGDGYYGNALRVAKDIPGLTDQDRAVLDRYATGSQHDTDHIALQDIAMRVYAAPQPAPDVAALVDALTMARETIASALRANAPDYFTTDADIARHVVIQRIDAAMQGANHGNQ